MSTTRGKASMTFTAFFVATTFSVFAMLFGVSGNAWATLIVEPDGLLVRDDMSTPGNTADDLLWIRDISQFSAMSYDQQKSAIAGITVSGYSGFRMANEKELFTIYNTTWNVFPYFSTTRVENQTEYIDGRADYAAPFANDMHLTIFSLHYVDGGMDVYGWGSDFAPDNLASPGLGAWAVYGQGPASVPEPSTMLLTVIGLAGFVIFRGRRQRS